MISVPFSCLATAPTPAFGAGVAASSPPLPPPEPPEALPVSCSAGASGKTWSSPIGLAASSRPVLCRSDCLSLSALAWSSVRVGSLGPSSRIFGAGPTVLFSRAGSVVGTASAAASTFFASASLSPLSGTAGGGGGGTSEAGCLPSALSPPLAFCLSAWSSGPIRSTLPVTWAAAGAA